MNRSLLLLLLLLTFLTPALHAQKTITFGNVPREALEMKRYEADTTANALVLYEKGDAAIKYDAWGEVAIYFEYQVRIKIFNDNALNEATVKIPLYQPVTNKERKEKIMKMEAVLVNPDGSKERITKDDLLYTDPEDNYKVATFTMPNVQEGCVIDYRYTIRNPFYYSFQTWKFQSHLPKLYSEYNTSIPANYSYHTKLYGPLKLKSTQSNLKRKCFKIEGLGSADCSAMQYIMDSIPAFTEEEYMTAEKNYLSAIRYELTTVEHFTGAKDHYAKNWETIDRELRSDPIGRESKKDGWFTNQFPETLMTAVPDLDKAKKIYALVRNHLFWNGKHQLHKEFSVKDTWKEKSGSAPAINTALLNALKAGGFEAHPVIVATRGHGFPSEEIPAMNDFNDLIVKLDVNGKSYLLDAAQKQMPFGMIRTDLINGKGRVMDFKKGSYWIQLLQLNAYSRRSFQASINIPESHAKVREITTGYYAIDKRREIAGMSKEDYEDQLADELERRGDFTLINLENKGLDDPEKHISTAYELELNKDDSSERLLLNPFILEAFTSNPFKLNTRTYPVDFGYPFSLHYMILVDIGDEYVLTHKPENQMRELPNKAGKLNYSINHSGQKLTVSLKMDIYDPLIAPAHYKALKELFNEFISLQTKKPITLTRQLKSVSENAGK